MLLHETNHKEQKETRYAPPTPRHDGAHSTPFTTPPPFLSLLAFCLSSTRDDEKSAAILKGLGECVPFEGEGGDDGGGSDEDDGPPAKKRRGRPPAGGGSKKAGKGGAKKAAGAKKGKGKAKR